MSVFAEYFLYPSPFMLDVFRARWGLQPEDEKDAFTYKTCRKLKQLSVTGNDAAHTIGSLKNWKLNISYLKREKKPIRCYFLAFLCKMIQMFKIKLRVFMSVTYTTSSSYLLISTQMWDVWLESHSAASPKVSQRGLPGTGPGIQLP